MATQSAARNLDTHTCPLTTPAAHVGGMITVIGFRSVNINGMLAAVVGDLSPCAAGGPNAIKQGSSTVNINGLPAARVLDQTVHLGGMISTGSPNVYIG